MRLLDPSWPIVSAGHADARQACWVTMTLEAVGCARTLAELCRAQSRCGETKKRDLLHVVLVFDFDS